MKACILVNSAGYDGLTSCGANAVAGFGAGAPDNTAVQELASALIAELAQYDSPGLECAHQEKTGHKRSPER